jgi:TRAP-type C4-dicarboxylate transport system permease small subunit
VTRLEKLKKIVYKLDDILGGVSSVFIFANMVVVTISVAMRILLHSPISGLTDIVGFLSALNAAFALGYTEKEKGFIQVDFVREFFPRSLQRVILSLISCISIVALGIITVQFFRYGLSTYANSNVTWVMFLPYYPIAFGCFLGMLFYTITSLLHFVLDIHAWKEVGK